MKAEDFWQNVKPYDKTPGAAENAAGRLFENRIDEDVITIEEFARLVGKAPKTDRNMIAARQMPFFKCGNKHLLRRSSLLKWLDKKEFKPWR